MKIKIGNMWDVFEESDLFVITTNSYIKKNGELVMGKGIAKEAKEKLIGIDLFAGRQILCIGKKNENYGFLILGNWFRRKKKGYTEIGLFQVKKHFKDLADLDIIKYSVEKLNERIKKESKEFRVNMNFPGIGNGGLKEEEVFPIISILPGNVTIWKNKEDEINANCSK